MADETRRPAGSSGKPYSRTNRSGDRSGFQRSAHSALSDRPQRGRSRQEGGTAGDGQSAAAPAKRGYNPSRGGGRPKKSDAGSGYKPYKDKPRQGRPVEVSNNNYDNKDNKAEEENKFRFSSGDSKEYNRLKNKPNRKPGVERRGKAITDKKEPKVPAKFVVNATYQPGDTVYMRDTSGKAVPFIVKKVKAGIIYLIHESGLQVQADPKEVHRQPPGRGGRAKRKTDSDPGTAEV